MNAVESTAACAHALERLRAGEIPPLARWLRAHLFDDVLSFWERHAIDEHGGLFTCLDQRGAVLSTDKWLWSQWRAVWVFSRIYNQIDHDVRWLNLARQIAAFCARTGWDASGEGWALVVSREGKILRGHESTYVDAFAVYGLVEFHRASGDDDMLRLACRTAEAALKTLALPYDTIPHFPYPIPRGAKPQGIPMLWSLSFAELGAALKNERYLNAAGALADEAFRDFYRPDRDLLVERVRLDGTAFPPPLGSAVVPGHVIENMWFQLRVAGLLRKGAGRDAEAFRLILRHLEAGWDHSAGGGILLAIDADGCAPVGWDFADAKLWWPHTEALFASLLGWVRTRDPVFHDWYTRLWRLCLEHFVDWENGEWRQKLGRAFVPIHDIVALPVKDPFHLPRSLILQLELLTNSATAAINPKSSTCQI